MNHNAVHCLFLAEMFQKYVSVLFGCYVILFVTSWPPYCFLVHDGQLAKIRTTQCILIVIGFLPFEQNDHGAPISVSLFTEQTAHF